LIKSLEIILSFSKAWTVHSIPSESGLGCLPAGRQGLLSRIPTAEV